MFNLHNNCILFNKQKNDVSTFVLLFDYMAMNAWLLKGICNIP